MPAPSRDSQSVTGEVQYSEHIVVPPIDVAHPLTRQDLARRSPERQIAEFWGQRGESRQFFRIDSMR